MFPRATHSRLRAAAGRPIIFHRFNYFTIIPSRYWVVWHLLHDGVAAGLSSAALPHQHPPTIAPSHAASARPAQETQRTWQLVALTSIRPSVCVHLQPPCMTAAPSYGAQSPAHPPRRARISHCCSFGGQTANRGEEISLLFSRRPGGERLLFSSVFHYRRVSP